MKGASSIQQGEESYCLQSFMEGLLSFFFSKHRALFDKEDCKYFLELANKQCSVSTPVDNCISINVLKLYLARILGELEHDPSSQVLFFAHSYYCLACTLSTMYVYYRLQLLLK